MMAAAVETDSPSVKWPERREHDKSPEGEAQKRKGEVKESLTRD